MVGHLVLASIWGTSLMLHQKKKMDPPLNYKDRFIALRLHVVVDSWEFYASTSRDFALCFNLGAFFLREGISEAKVKCILSFSCDETWRISILDVRDKVQQLSALVRWVSSLKIDVKFFIHDESTKCLIGIWKWVTLSFALGVV